MAPKTLYLVFKTHLDVGFTNYARVVTENYFNSYIPRAIELSRTMREDGGQERFVWTTGSWLIYEFLERADPQKRRLMEEAIAAGDIVWHGLPFTTHSELMDASMFRYGLSLSQQLDKRFGKKTIAAKMTDVPGHTRGIVPLLNEAGIEFLHIGVNSASKPPDVPPVFVWKHPDGADIVVMYSKSGYGNVAIVPGLDEAISFEHTGDNQGPQSPEHIVAIYEKRAEEFPGTKIIASGIDPFAKAILRIKSQLPVVTEEIGDTWIHGIGTDPAKVAGFRELSRVRKGWLEAKKVDIDDKRVGDFSRCILVIPEHTWGMDEKTHLNDYANYSCAELRKARAGENFQTIEASWAEQRAYLTSGVAALGDSPLADETNAALRSLKPVKPDTSGFSVVSDFAEWHQTDHFCIRFDAGTGAISDLVLKTSDCTCASPENPLGLVHYELFSEADYARYFAQYNVSNVDWAVKDFTKPGMGVAIDSHKQWDARLDKLYRDSTGTRFIVEMSMPSPASQDFGCPERFVAEIELPREAPIVRYTLSWFGKQACRIAEATWVSFQPRVTSAREWTMDKLGSDVWPLDVISNGNRKLHAVGSVRCGSGPGSISIESLDAPLVAPGRPSLLDFDNELPDLNGGMHFNLHNNIWGTNFPMWYEDDAKFRFILRAEDSSC